MSALEKSNSRKDFMKTVGICIPIKSLKHYNGEHNIFYEGEYNYSKVEVRNNEEVLNEETEACYNVLDFLENMNIPGMEKVDIQFEDIKETYFDWRINKIKMSPRVNKFKAAVERMDLETILVLMYLRAYGYKEAYKEEGYEGIFNFVMNTCDGNMRIKEIGGVQKTETVVAESVFNNLIRTEFRVEELAWEWVLRVLEMSNYSIESYGRKCSFTKSDVEQIKSYCLYRKLKRVNVSRKRGRLVISDSYSFVCK